MSYEEARKQALIGKWVSSFGHFYMFFEDGKFHSDHLSSGVVEGRYILVGDELKMSIPGHDLRGLRFRVIRDKLVVTGYRPPYDTFFTKQ